MRERGAEERPPGDLRGVTHGRCAKYVLSLYSHLRGKYSPSKWREQSRRPVTLIFERLLQAPHLSEWHQPTSVALSLVGVGGDPAGGARPVGVLEDARLVEALEGVRAEVVALGLQRV